MLKNLLHKHHPKKHAKSFQYAFDGVFHALLNEPNFRAEVVIALVIFLTGIFFKITNIEWAILILSLGMLLSAEMANTVIEVIMDHLIPEQSQVVKIIKDLMAGFVLIAAIVTSLIVILIFWPYISIFMSL